MDETFLVHTTKQVVPELGPLIQEQCGSLFSAAEILVQHRGEIVYHASAGEPETMQSERRFDLASLTKLFTTTAIMRLVDAGKIGLDQPVAEIIPEIGGRRAIGPFEEPTTGLIRSYNYAQQEVDANIITIRQLLSHSSGLPAWLPLYRTVSSAAAWQELFQTTWAYPIGAQIVYSDIGFILLGEVIARTLNTSLDEAIDRLVLQPIGANNTGYNPANKHATVPTEWCAWRQRRIHGEVHDENAARLGGVSGHAGLFGTASDLLRLAEATLLSQIAPSANRLLRPKTAQEMLREHANDGEQRRALGWALYLPDASCGPRWSEASYGHTGFTGTSLWIDPEKALICVLLTNRVFFGRSNAKDIYNFRIQVHTAIGAAFE